MKIEPLNIILNKEYNNNNIKFYFISGNETTLIEKVTDKLISKYRESEQIVVSKIDTLSNFVHEEGLFGNKTLFLGKNCKDINEKNIDLLRQTDAVFVFIHENSQKIKPIKKFFEKDKMSYLIDCYELNKNSKVNIINEFLMVNNLKIEKSLYWMLVEKLDNRYVFLENSLNNLIKLDQRDINYQNIRKLLSLDTSGKEKVFFNLFKSNSEIVRVYRDKILSNSDVNEFYYYCRYFCQLIIDSKNENDYSKKIPAYLFKEKGFLIDLFRRFNSKKKILLLNLLSKTEYILRKESALSTFTGLRFLLSVKKISIS